MAQELQGADVFCKNTPLACSFLPPAKIMNTPQACSYEYPKCTTSSLGNTGNNLLSIKKLFNCASSLKI